MAGFWDTFSKVASSADDRALVERGEEEGAAQNNAPSFDLEKRNAYLEQEVVSLKAELAQKSIDYTFLQRLYDLEREANMMLLAGDNEQDDYTVEITPKIH
jgi:hypothetical protein